MAAKKSKSAAKSSSAKSGKPAKDKPKKTRNARAAKLPAADSTAKQAHPSERKKLALDAAALVLAETAEPLNCQDLIEVMASKDYWTSPVGKTPASTLYSAILREIRTKGGQSQFQKTERGKFART